MQNHLKNETSPYLLQHANNPVNWYPWCEEAFRKAKEEDKPVFLSIGYSTCHWCHVMAHESFEDEHIAGILNQHFVSIKVDKEERPDIDSIYMSVCQAFTGSGGWPTTIFMTPDQKPFFAGTYFAKTAKYGRIGFEDLLEIIHEKWQTDRKSLIESADEMVNYLRKTSFSKRSNTKGAAMDEKLIGRAVKMYERLFDERFGGFGEAPKFPTPHNLLFLMNYYERSKDQKALNMVEKTLLQMCRGGIFDHIGGGFSRYSTDYYFLAPHFEKMLYDNALLILAYCKAFQMTKKTIYLDVAKKVAGYILKEMTDSEGGFYSAQDADSEGEEGKYYLFQPEEIVGLLGKEIGEAWNQYFDITPRGNFEGKNIPNLLKNQSVEESLYDKKYGADITLEDKEKSEYRDNFEQYIPVIYEYRKNRYRLHLDGKILTSWNALMIAAMCHLYRVSQDKRYLNVARKAQSFIEKNLSDKDTLFVTYREGKRGQKGFLDDYANEIFALLALYEATLETQYLEKAKLFCERVISSFYDKENGGFYLYEEESEQLILRPKETYDGAVPSGNSMMAYNLVRLHWITGEENYEELAKQQLAFMEHEAKEYPTGYAMFLVALLDYVEVPDKVTVVLDGKDKWQELSKVPCQISLGTIINVMEEPTKEYVLKNEKTTYYVCKGQSCKAPVNALEEVMDAID